MKQIQETLTGNPYAGHAEQHITWTHDWQGDTGDTPETQLANQGIAQAYATLTLAYEQRKANEHAHTANLIALMDHARTEATKTALEDTALERMGIIQPSAARTRYPTARELLDERGKGAPA